MQVLCIGVDDPADEMVRTMTDELSRLANCKVSCTVDDTGTSGSVSIICSMDDERDPSKRNMKPFEALRVHVSNVLADYIIKKYEDKLISRIINGNYCYFNVFERREILNLALRIIRNEDKVFLNSLFQMRRRNIIIRKLQDYFEGSNNLILDGFVNFRLKDYTRDLEEIVDKAVDDFLMDREYREFIKLLRYFVDIQEPKCALVHVARAFDSRYLLLDENRQEITNECIQDFIKEIAEGEINYDDLLVSSLITLAPRRIIIHSVNQFRNKELLETIKNVFFGRVAICGGCDICMLEVVKSEHKN